MRLGVLQLLQTLAKSDARALHAQWSSVLPAANPLAPRPLNPHLLVLLLHDPMPKVCVRRVEPVHTGTMIEAGLAPSTTTCQRVGS